MPSLWSGSHHSVSGLLGSSWGPGPSLAILSGLLSQQLWPLSPQAPVRNPLTWSGLLPGRGSRALPPFKAPPLANRAEAPPPPPAHPSGAPPGGGEGGGARSSSGPKVAPRARTAGPGAGARRATRPRCWSRNRSVSARCSGSVGGSSAGPTGPAASADRRPEQGEPESAPVCRSPLPNRAFRQAHPAGPGVPRPQPRESRGARVAPAGSP